MKTLAKNFGLTVGT